MQRLCLFVLALATFVPLGGLAQEESRDGSFGFDGKHIFKFNRGVGPVALGDLDRDGKNDMLVADGYRAELVLLLQDPEKTGKVHGSGPNSVDDPDGFHRIAIPIPSKVDAMLLEDIDGDGWLDLLISGSGALEVRWGGADLRFQEKARYRLRDALSGHASLTCDRTSRGIEVFVLAKKGIHRFRSFSREQSPDRSFLPGSAGNPTGIFLADLDADGHRDLLTVLNDREHPYRVRLRREDGEFGPETLLAGELPGGIVAVARPEGAEIISLTLGKGRFDVLGLTTSLGRDPYDLPPAEVFPLDATGLEAPILLVDDLDNDGDPDVAITHRSENQIYVFTNEGGQLVAGTPSPTLRKVVSLAVTSRSGDALPEVLVTSAEEKVIGASSVEKGVLRFPRILEGIVEPLLGAEGRFGGSRRLVVVAKDSGRLVLRILSPTEGGAWSTHAELALGQLGGAPGAVLLSDMDRDGNDEILLFVPFKAPRLYRVSTGESPEITELPAPGVLEVAARGAVTATANGDLLVASGNHCRRIRLNDGKPEVVYQVNGTGTAAIACALEVRLEKDGTPNLVMIDKKDQSLAIYGRDETQPQLIRALDGAYDRVLQGRAADLDGDGRDEIILLDPRFLAVIRTDGNRRQLESHFTYPHPDEKTRYVTGTTGDLNGDGELDLVLSNGALRELQILRAGGSHAWTHALRFPVYEAKSFSGRGSGPLEPRWVRVVDLTNDGLDDLLILVHDRIILYPQDGAS